MNTRILSIVLTAAAASAATVPADFRQSGPGVTRDAADLSAWWKQLHDPELDSLVDRAIKGNLDLRIAASRIAQARALERVQRSSCSPR